MLRIDANISEGFDGFEGNEKYVSISATENGKYSEEDFFTKESSLEECFMKTAMHFKSDTIQICVINRDYSIYNVDLKVNVKKLS